MNLLREGASHSVFVNRAKGKSSTVPRHSEVNEFTARKSAATWKCLCRSRRPTSGCTGCGLSHATVAPTFCASPAPVNRRSVRPLTSEIEGP